MCLWMALFNIPSELNWFVKVLRFISMSRAGVSFGGMSKFEVVYQVVGGRCVFG